MVSFILTSISGKTHRRYLNPQKELGFGTTTRMRLNLAFQIFDVAASCLEDRDPARRASNASTSRAWPRDAVLISTFQAELDSTQNLHVFRPFFPLYSTCWTFLF
jgi:hypothetical protein